MEPNVEQQREYNDSEQELRDAVFRYFEIREELPVRWQLTSPDGFDPMIDRVVRSARREIADWNEQRENIREIHQANWVLTHRS